MVCPTVALAYTRIEILLIENFPMANIKIMNKSYELKFI
jgi:hypothetical protein